MRGVELKGLKVLQSLNKPFGEIKIEQGEQLSYFTLSLEKLIPGKFQPRKIFADDAINDLANSIKANGIIQPLIVRKVNSASYEIIAGERRWRAAKIAGLEVVPVIEQQITDQSALAFALVENVQRENLNALEHAISLEKLKNEFMMTHDEIAEIIGCSRSSISNLLRLLSLSEEVKDLLLHDKLEMGHARALLTLEEEEQIALANDIIVKKLSVREIEKLIQKSKHRQQKKRVYPKFSMKTGSLQEELTKKLLMDVKVNMNEQGEGSLAIRFTSQGELQWLVDKLKKI